jgi:hypothetical protein
MIHNPKSYQNLVKRLTKANILETHAQAIATEIESVDNKISREYIDLKFRELSAMTEARIEFVRSDILKWIIGIFFVQTISIIISALLSN